MNHHVTRAGQSDEFISPTFPGSLGGDTHQRGEEHVPLPEGFNPNKAHTPTMPKRINFSPNKKYLIDRRGGDGF